MTIEKEKIDEEHLKQALNVSRLYYIDNVSQTEIAKKLKISRPTVSRLLQLAHEANIVHISINDPFENKINLPKQLMKKYNLKKVIVADQIGDSYQNILLQLGKLSADYLSSIVQDNDIIGLTWGQTMAAVAENLKATDKQNIQTVYLKGTVSNSKHNNYSSVITNKFNSAFHTQTEILPVPVIFDNAETRNVVLQDQFIKEIIQKGEAAQIALFTVGTTQSDALLFKLGYLDPEQINFLKKNAVGDILSQFITQDGNLADLELAKRTVSLPLNYLKEKRYSILVAGGAEKLSSIHACLLGGYANVLITDINNAQKLVKL